MTPPPASDRVRLRVGLLGRLEARTESGRPIRLPGRHAQALFALLILTRRPTSREALAAHLWPDAGSASGASLRQALWLVRQGLSEAGVPPDALFDIDTETIGVRVDASIELDVDAFEGCPLEPPARAEEAIGRYPGDLLEGLGHDCFAAERERLSDRYEDALAVVAAGRLAAGDSTGARTAAQRLIERDPLREEAHATLIGVHGLTGSRSQVVRQYRRLREVLDRELGEVPLPDTEVIYRQALERTVRRAAEHAAVLRAQVAAEAEVDGARPPVLVAIGR